jgi:hypothetical protein
MNLLRHCWQLIPSDPDNLPPPSSPLLPFSTHPPSPTFHPSNFPNRLSTSANHSSNFHLCDATLPIDDEVVRFEQSIDRSCKKLMEAIKKINLKFFFALTIFVPHRHVFARNSHRTRHCNKPARIWCRVWGKLGVAVSSLVH